MQLLEKHIVITGTSRGIGRAIVKACVTEGASVYCISRNQNNISEEYAPLCAPGATLKFYACDIADETAVKETVKTILKDAPRIDGLVNNAGITRDGLIFRLSSEAWDTVLTTNLKSCFLTSQAVAMPMAKNRGGAIVNISSIVGLIGNAGQSNYCAAKAGLIGLTKSLARELGARGVRVNAIAPGYIETDMTDVMNETQKKAFIESIPMARPGSSEEVAKACVFLLSSNASYITGEVIRVSGGLGI